MPTPAENPPANQSASDSSSPKGGISISTTLIEMAQAFEAWERDFRAAPEQFLSAQECAAAEISELSASRASHFAALLGHVAKQPAAS